jgi:hypothetical protein
MLSKLIKYEIKATGRIFLPLFLALLFFAGITRFISPSSLGSEEWYTPAIISMAIYVIIMVGMFVMSFIIMIQRFYKNLLSDEGYLMFTLPVKPWKHIICKLLVSMFWIMASGLAALISILIIALKKGAISELMKESGPFFHQVFEKLGASTYLLTFEIIIGIFIILASSILIVYASMAIGNLFNQHKILASFGAFIALKSLSQTLVLLICLIPGNVYFSNIHISSNNFMSMQPFIQMIIAFGIIIAGLLGIAFFATTNYILSKRLNLE